LDPNIVRWIVASCRTFFNTRKGNYPLFFENTGPKKLQDAQGNPIASYAEFRVNGPYYRKITTTEEFYDVELNVLCHTGINNTDSDEIERMLGTYFSAFAPTIPILRYGNGLSDDQSQIGCLMLYGEKGDQIRVSRFGQANPDTKLAQGSIDGSYRMRLTL